MECPKCHNAMTDEQRICEKCGWERHHFPGGINTLDEKKEPILSPKKKVIAPPPMPNNKDENLDNLDIFIGRNHEKIKKKRFSFAAFFFGPCYFFYRKLYLFALFRVFVSFCLEILFTIFVFKGKPFYQGNYISIITECALNLAVSIYFAFFFKPYYLHFAQKKIEKIQSQNDSKEVCIEKIRQMGGTNNIILSIFISILLSILYIRIITSITMFLYFKSLFSFFH